MVLQRVQKDKWGILAGYSTNITTKELSKGESYLIKEWNVCYLGQV